MIYYRVAWKHHQSSVWQWKSTYLTSLEAVFRFLRLSAIPLDQLRVFASSSGQDFNALLEEENKGWQHPSVAAEQFLCERGFPSSKMIGEASELRGSGTRENQEKKAVTAPLPPVLNESSTQAASLDEKSTSPLDRRRLESERGEGGDHDLPYTFALPLSLPQTLAWIRLLAQVQRGEVEP